MERTGGVNRRKEDLDRYKSNQTVNGRRRHKGHIRNITGSAGAFASVRLDERLLYGEERAGVAAVANMELCVPLCALPAVNSKRSVGMWA